MSLTFAEDFEAGLGSWTLNGVPTTGAAAVNTGSLGMIVDTTGGAATQYIQKTLTGGTRVVAFRCYFNVQTAPVGSPNFVQGNCAAGDAKITMLSTGALRAQLGSGTTQTSSVLSAGWHRLDVLFNTSAATATIDWQIDGVAQTQATRAQAATDMSALRVGLLTSTTARFYVDTLVYGNATTDYPFGPTPKSVSVGHASGTGATFTVQDAELVAQPGHASGTGAVLGGVAQAGVSAGFPTGTGQAHSLVAAVATSLATVTGTGAAASSGRTIAPSVESAAGTGAAFDVAGNPTAGGSSLVITIGVS